MNISSLAVFLVISQLTRSLVPVLNDLNGKLMACAKNLCSLSNQKTLVTIVNLADDNDMFNEMSSGLNDVKYLVTIRDNSINDNKIDYTFAKNLAKNDDMFVEDDDDVIPDTPFGIISDVKDVVNEDVVKFENVRRAIVQGDFVVIIVTAIRGNYPTYLPSTLKSVLIRNGNINIIIYPADMGEIQIYESDRKRMLLLNNILIIDKNCDVYMTKPFDGNWDLNGMFISLGTCEMLKYNDIKHLFKQAPVKDYTGQKVYVVFTDLQGAFYPEENPPTITAEFKLIEEITKIVNFQFVSTMGLSFDPDYKLQFGNIKLRDTSNGYTYPHGYSSMLIAVPLPKKIAAWRGFLYVFNSHLWATLGFTTLVVLLITHAIAKAAIDPEKYDEFIICFLGIFAILLGQSFEQPLRRIMRILFLTWTIFCFIFMNAYCGLFLGHLVNPIYEKPIDSVRDLVEANATVLYHMLHYLEMEDFKNSDYQTLSNNFMECSAPGYCYSQIDGTHALMETDVQLEFIRNTLVKPHLVPEFHTFSISSHLTTFTLEPSTEILNEPIQKFIENGIYNKWIRDLVFKSHTPSEEFIKISLEHLALAFYIYLVSIIFCIAVFAAELYCSY